MSETPGIHSTLQDQFDQERFARALQAETSIEKLRDISLKMLTHTFAQKATIKWLATELASKTGEELMNIKSSNPF